MGGKPLVYRLVRWNSRDYRITYLPGSIMTKLNISLTQAMKSFVEEQATKGGYSTVSEYVRALIREAQIRAAKEEVEAKLVEGLESGPATPMTKDDWNDLKRRVWERAEHSKRP